MLVFDITNSDSFHRVKYWFNQIQECSVEDIPKVLIANKSDLEDDRAVALEDCATLANEIKCTYEEVSAKTGNNIESTFDNFVKCVFKAMLSKDDGVGETTFILNQKNELTNDDSSKTCC